MIRSWLSDHKPTDEDVEEQEPREPGELVASLDIGTTKVCAMIGEVFDDRVEIIGVGTAASSGCIRMLNQEVVELFDNTPVGTKVIVQ